MKIIIDTDGTMTDFNKYIVKEAVPYFKNNYGMDVVNANTLEIEDMMNMNDFFKNLHRCSDEIAAYYTKDVLNRFWIHPRYLKYTLFYGFRKGMKEYIKRMILAGHHIEVHTSRAKTTNRDFEGILARTITELQYSVNGIHLKSKDFYYYKNDDEKIKGIIDTKPDIVFEDKSEVIQALNNKNIKCICIRGRHNEDTKKSNNVRINTGNNAGKINYNVKKLIGKNEQYFKRGAISEKYFYSLSKIRIPIVKYFNPIIINPNKIYIDNSRPVLYVSNHRSTVDPIVINSILNTHIHWVALKRFFEGSDSIFNNSKNPYLCRLTSSSLKKLECIPIERKSDNPDANNNDSIKDIISFLEINQNVGIFPEGTTRRKNGKDFGEFDKSFTILSKKTNALIQPVNIYWYTDSRDKKHVIVNFGEIISPANKKGSDILNEFMEFQVNALKENKKISEQAIIDKRFQNNLIHSSKKCCY